MCGTKEQKRTSGCWLFATARFTFSPAFSSVCWWRSSRSHLGFLVLATLRSFEIVPRPLAEPLTRITTNLTVVSMAALGLGVDIRVLTAVGGRVTAAVTLSLLLLLLMSVGLIHFVR